MNIYRIGQHDPEHRERPQGRPLPTMPKTKGQNGRPPIDWREVFADDAVILFGNDRAAKRSAKTRASQIRNEVVRYRAERAVIVTEQDGEIAVLIVR